MGLLEYNGQPMEEGGQPIDDQYTDCPPCCRACWNQVQIRVSGVDAAACDDQCIIGTASSKKITSLAVDGDYTMDTSGQSGPTCSDNNSVFDDNFYTHDSYSDGSGDPGGGCTNFLSQYTCDEYDIFLSYDVGESEGVATYTMTEITISEACNGYDIFKWTGSKGFTAGTTFSNQLACDYSPSGGDPNTVPLAGGGTVEILSVS